jgi:hypothetical protein
MMLAGASGALNIVFVNLTALNGLYPQSEVYLSRIESVEVAAWFDVYKITITLLFNVPESKIALAPSEPVGIFHSHPVAAPDDAVANGRAGATYLYLLAPHTFAVIGCIVMLAGANGAFNFVFVIFNDLYFPSPQSD